MEKEFKLLTKEIGYDGFFRLERYLLKHTLYEGGWSDNIVRELFERGHAVAVLLYDPDTDKVVLVEQFRIGAIHMQSGAWLLELVAGMIESGETNVDVAERETHEEAGCEIKKLIPICEYMASPGGTTEVISLFCGIVDASSAGGVYGIKHEGEDIKVNVLTYEQAVDELYLGKINSASPIMAMQWLMINRENVRKNWQLWV